MTTPKPDMMTDRTLLLAKVQTARGVDPVPDQINDAFLVGELDLQLDVTQLERKVMRTSFSPVPTDVGRTMVNVSFTHEIKGSGDSGITRPKLGTLLLGCSMKELLVTVGAATQIDTPKKFGVVRGPKPTWAKNQAPTGVYGSYLVDVIKGGASGTAKLRVSRWGASGADDTVLPNLRFDVRTNKSAGVTAVLAMTDPEAPTLTIGGVPVEGDAIYTTIGGLTFEYVVTAADEVSASATDDIAAAIAALIDADARVTASATASVVTFGFSAAAGGVIVTSGTTQLSLGASGASITPTWAGNLVAGQKWIVALFEPGYTYFPLSAQKNAKMLTLYVYLDGQLHIVQDCKGTVTFDGEAGGLGSAKFEFTGTYASPVEEPMPEDAELEPTSAPQIEVAEQSIEGKSDFCSQSFTITLANTMNPKDCMNAVKGFKGMSTTGRKPTAKLNPEASYEAYTGMWKAFSTAVQFPLHLRVGTVLGNTVRFYADRANYTNLSYGDRNGTRTLEAEFSLNGVSDAGDDELRIAFP
ncbi:tail tube protein [Rhodobacter phage RcKickapoo]|nr:tail tube protein [Rhodobacter phage RcKickapoo]